jgi:guanine deaminase
MQMAVDLSEQALDTGKGGPFGAIIVRRDVIIGSSGNCEFRDTDPTSHAEIMAIRDACANIGRPDLTGATIYSSAEPCPMCMGAIYWAKINVVYYANTQEDSQRFGFLDKKILAELRKEPTERKVQSIRLPLAAALNVFEKARRKGVAKKKPTGFKKK